MHKAALAIFLALVGVALMSTAQSQQYPPGTIRIIAPGPPGSPGTSAHAGSPNSSPRR